MEKYVNRFQKTLLYGLESLGECFVVRLNGLAVASETRYACPRKPLAKEERRGIRKRKGHGQLAGL
jgi:hypothetical protein